MRSFHHAAIIVHPAQEEAGAFAEEVLNFVREQGGIGGFVTFFHDDAIDPQLDDKRVDLLIAVGGDGTMLRASHIGGPRGIPILGINMGKLGFLTEVRLESWQAQLRLLLDGFYRLEKRMMLHGEHWRGEYLLKSWEVLNEMVVVRGRFVRPITLGVNVGCCPLVSYVADGLIVSSATGSTAYSLAAGGPILMPELRNMIIIPISPHFSVERAFVLSEEDQISIRLDTEHEAVISADGQRSVMMENGDIVKVRASDYSAEFIRFSSAADFNRHLLRYMEKNPIASKIIE